MYRDNEVSEDVLATARINKEISLDDVDRASSEIERLKSYMHVAVDSSCSDKKTFFQDMLDSATVLEKFIKNLSQ